MNLRGNSLSNVIRGGKRSSTLWGGGGDDSLIGGDGSDIFRFNSSDGNVTISSGDSNDIVDMTSFNVSDIAGWEFNDSGVVIATFPIVPINSSAIVAPFCSFGAS